MEKECPQYLTRVSERTKPLANMALIHPSAIIESPSFLGDNTRIWAFTHISKGVHIGHNCTIGEGVYIGPGVKIGDNVKIQNHALIYEGVELEDNVFIGPSVVTTNDLFPRCGRPWKVEKTFIKQGASIGANSTILCGITIGRNAMTGIGSVVIESIDDDMLVVGNPATVVKRLSPPSTLPENRAA